MPGIQSTPTKPFDPTTIAYPPPTTTVTKVVDAPVVIANEENLKGYGHIVPSSPSSFPIEITRWPAQGWRPVDPNSGDQGGVTEGIFEFWWKGDTLYACNNAVGDSYLFAWSTLPENAASEGDPTVAREKAVIWRANYHPDGGQLFYPVHGQSFVVSLALPGDDVRPEDFQTFKVEGGKGLYIHPNIWHAAVVPLDDACELLDRQGRVHARVSVDFVREFGCFLGSVLK